jgi:large exoprotein involved in heme utilization and adhesion
VAVPQENNDIIANAFEGKGGLIDITAFGVFGFAKNAQLTSKSDITAFSQTNPLLNGAIEINTLGIDPTQGLVNLPSIPLSVEISEGCQASYRNGESVQFVNQGRGGVASPPEELGNAEVFIADWIDLDFRNQSITQRKLIQRLTLSGKRRRQGNVERQNQNNCQSFAKVSAK